MKKGKIKLLSLSFVMIASLFIDAKSGEKEQFPFADPVSVTNEKIDVTNLKCETVYNPQDEFYSKQGSALNNIGEIKKVWDKTKGEGTTIAIIDSGIDWTHPDFYDEDGNSKLLMSDARYYAHVKSDGGNWRTPTSNETILSSDLKYFVTSKSYIINNVTYSGNDVIRHNGETSHGTNTASVAASYAHGNADIGVIGIAPMAKILPIKVDMYMDSIGAALEYIHTLNNDTDSTNNVDVVNISICGASTWSTVTSGARNLVNDGTIVVASAGNNNVSTIQYPAGDANVLGVGALAENSSTAKASFSNFNPTGSTSSSSKLNVDLTAPGYVYAADYTTYSTYKNTQGTSFSSPIVAGAAALWKSLNKSGTVSQFETALFNSCVDIGDSGWDTTFGYGRLDIGSLIGTSNIVDISSVSIPESATVQTNKTVQLNKTVTPSNATSKDFRWWSMNERVATVDHNGVVTGVSAGSTTIYCKSLANDNIKDTCTLTVQGDYVAVTGLTLTSNNELTLTVGGTSQIQYTVSPANATNKNVTFSLNENNGVISVSETGLITGLSEGEEIVEVSTVDGNYTQDIYVSVGGVEDLPDFPTNFIFTSKSWADSTNSWTSGKDGGQLTTNQGIQVSTGVTGANATTKNDFKDVSKVVVDYCTNAKDGNGTISIKVGNAAFGSYSVKAPSSDGTTLRQCEITSTTLMSGKVNITVSCSKNSIYIYGLTIYEKRSGGDTPTVTTPTLVSLSSTGTYATNYTSGESFNYSKLTIFANYSNNTSKDVTDDVTWTPATLTTGTTKVTASYTENSVTKTLDFTGIAVHAPTIAVTNVSLNKTTLSLAIGGSETLVATITPSNATNKAIKWASSDEDVVTVNNGVVEAVSSGTATIYVNSIDNETIFATCSVTVLPSQTEEYTGTYYNSITATSGASLLGQLHNLMFDTHTWYPSYNDCRDENGAYSAMDPGSTPGTLTDFYTQHDIGAEWAGSSSFVGHWNREHVWCQSHSANLWDDTNGSTRGGGADYHHVRPLEMTLNSARNNNEYGEVAVHDSTTAKYSRNTDSTQAYLGGYLQGGTFEPLDSVKGDVARILMYVYTHYSSGAGGTTPSTYSSYVGDLKFNDIICYGSSLEAAINMLLKWNTNDPVSDAERTRNEAAYNYQGNRNPFIDHPEYANAIWGTPVETKTLSSISLSNKKTEYSVGDDFVKPTVTANYSDSSSTNVTSSATCSGYDLTTTGQQTVTVSYTEGGVTKTATYTIVVSASSSTGGETINLSFAFSTNPGGWPTENSSTLTSYTYTLNSVNYTFGLKNVKQNSGYLMLTQPSVLGLPAIDDYKLTKVVAKNSGGCSTSVCVGISSSSSNGDYISGGNSVTWANTSSSYTYELTNTEENTVYYLYVTNKNAQIISLDLTYEPVGGNVPPTPIDPEITSICLSENTKTIDLYNEIKTFSLTPTVQFVGDIDTTVTWSSSVSSVASVSSTSGSKDTAITITAYTVGTTTITATCGEQTATCIVTVVDSTLVSLELVSSEKEVSLNKGNNKKYTVSATLTATFKDGRVEEVTPDSSNYTIDTSTLGEKQIQATFRNVTVTDSVLVTNKNADIGDTSTITKEKTLTGQSWLSYVTDSGDNCLEYSMSSSSGDETIKIQRKHTASVSNGFQFKKDTVGYIFNISDNGRIKTISFTGDGDDLVLYGGTSVDSCINRISNTAVSSTHVADNETEYSATSDYEFDLSNSDYHYFKITRDNVSTTTTCTNLKISYETISGTAHDANALEQAKAWAQYFLSLTSPICSANPNGDNADNLNEIWSSLMAEYNLMVADAKEQFQNSSDSDIVNARARYMHIVSHYGVEVSNFAHIQVSNKNQFSLLSDIELFSNNKGTNIFVITLGLISGISIIGFVNYRKRKEN